MMQPNDRYITHLTLDPLPRSLGMLLDVLDRVTNNLTPNRILNLTIDTKVVTPQPPRTNAVHRRLGMLLDVMDRDAVADNLLDLRAQIHITNNLTPQSHPQSHHRHQSRHTPTPSHQRRHRPVHWEILMQPNDRHITHLTLNPVPRRLSMLLDVMHRATNNVTSNRILKLTIDTKVVTPHPPRTDAVFALCSGRS